MKMQDIWYSCNLSLEQRTNPPIQYQPRIPVGPLPASFSPGFFIQSSTWLTVTRKTLSLEVAYSRNLFSPSARLCRDGSRVGAMSAHPDKLKDVGRICRQAAGFWLFTVQPHTAAQIHPTAPQLCAHVGSAMSQAAWMKMPSGARLPLYRSSNCCLYSS